ncbi:alanine--tRNA ligase [Desulfosarcina ovata subsp. sediminis]|uniref:Alanine--tRNA ligase n=1 Tax=Desulfosarcina ovata subsp. sediminis TaxID=885957 RepID=A0A5K7ZM65_9BACT|nr:alanine--tRNA ligase [Desulfosarcina ovata]BBO79540.1 alanine--tRNA ligase [Desulfosarcina ovata subsp. sediminis]
MTGNEIRQRYLDFFQKHNHRVVRSSSLIPQDDPTLLFTNAGMVQFKRTFLGEEKRDYRRATTSQKCVRAGGKHNDLENVGYTARHHTFFEMLGNFSFGDYFKEKAVEFAWDLLVNGYGLPADKLWASVYLDDDEAWDLWTQRIGIPESRMIRLGEADNFWAMGDTGPCGPCSEIHLDRGAEHGCGRPDCDVACDCDRFLEIWNLVFMQFNRDAAGVMTPLPKPSIDTGLGLERMASIIQNVTTNFETDLIFPIIQRTEALAERPYGNNDSDDVAMKVIADHSRAAAFLIGDGVLPSNEGRGYVLRRIMRRAIRYGRNIGLAKPFLHDTARVVFDIMEPAYPDLKAAAAFITNVIENEEIRFSETLDNGLRVLNDTLGEIRAKGSKQVPGDLIFKLYDTFGFPVDIVRDVVRDEGLTLDTDGFEQRMAEQRRKSRSKIAFSGVSDAYRQLSASGEKPEFVGYGTLSCEARVVLVVKDGQGVDAADAGTRVEVVTTATPFYGEAGGQVGDHGTITAPGMEIGVDDTVKDPTGIIIHKGEIKSGRLENGQTVMLRVDGQRRGDIALNHTATHILHAALRHELGDHVKQAGSLVSPDRLRFDFTHFSQIDPESLERIEAFVNARIRMNVPVAVDEMGMEDAVASGATALFEEKYGDRVRVISLEPFSRELCGGTHAGRTGDIGLFTIISEASVASGVRRIEALTGRAALEHVQKTGRILQAVSHLVKDKPDAVAKRVETILGNLKSLEKEAQQLKTQLAEIQAKDSGGQALEINGVSTIVQAVSVDQPAALRELADRFKDQIGSGIVVLGAEAGGKALLIVVVTKDLTNRFHAGKMIKAIASEVGGGGGGRPDMAQAGGTRPQNLDQALAKARELIEQG